MFYRHFLRLDKIHSQKQTKTCVNPVFLQGVYWIKPSDSNTGWNKENPHEQSLYLEQELSHGLGPSLQNTLAISIAHQLAS